MQYLDPSTASQGNHGTIRNFSSDSSETFFRSFGTGVTVQFSKGVSRLTCLISETAATCSLYTRCNLFYRASDLVETPWFKALRSGLQFWASGPWQLPLPQPRCSTCENSSGPVMQVT